MQPSFACEMLITCACHFVTYDITLVSYCNAPVFADFESEICLLESVLMENFFLTIGRFCSPDYYYHSTLRYVDFIFSCHVTM